MTLTKREAQILAGAQAGEKIWQTAARLGRSPSTVARQRASIRRKLGMRKYLRCSLAAWGLQ
jgi:DNA-binding NarL/FixJ family response regulator